VATRAVLLGLDIAEGGVMSFGFLRFRNRYSASSPQCISIFSVVLPMTCKERFAFYTPQNCCYSYHRKPLEDWYSAMRSGISTWLWRKAVQHHGGGEVVLIRMFLAWTDRSSKRARALGCMNELEDPSNVSDQPPRVGGCRAGRGIVRKSKVEYKRQ
jgi:hypothetical protein